MPIFNAVHPGRILREWMGEDITVTKLAGHLRVTRPMVSNILNGKAGVSAEMAIRLAKAFPKTEPRFWMSLQANYELAKALREERTNVVPVRAAEIASI